MEYFLLQKLLFECHSFLNFRRSTNCLLNFLVFLIFLQDIKLWPWCRPAIGDRTFGADHPNSLPNPQPPRVSGPLLGGMGSLQTTLQTDENSFIQYLAYIFKSIFLSELKNILEDYEGTDDQIIEDFPRLVRTYAMICQGLLKSRKKLVRFTQIIVFYHVMKYTSVIVWEDITRFFRYCSRSQQIIKEALTRSSQEIFLDLRRIPWEDLRKNLPRRKFQSGIIFFDLIVGSSVFCEDLP